MKLVFIEITLLVGAVQAQADWSIAEQIQKNMINMPSENSNKGDFANADEQISSGQQSNQIFFIAPAPYMDHHTAEDPDMHHYYPPVHGYVYPPAMGYAPYAAPVYPYIDPYVMQAYQDPLIMEEFHEFLDQRRRQEELSAYEHDENPHMREDIYHRNDIKPVFPYSDDELNFLPDSGKMFAPPELVDFNPKETEKKKPTSKPVFPTSTPKAPTKPAQQPEVQKAVEQPKTVAKPLQESAPSMTKPMSVPITKHDLEIKEKQQKEPPQQPIGKEIETQPQVSEKSKASIEKEEKSKKMPVMVDPPMPTIVKETEVKPTPKVVTPIGDSYSKDRGSFDQQQEFLGGTRDKPIYIPEFEMAPSSPVYQSKPKPMVNPDTEYMPQAASRPIKTPIYQPKPIYQTPTTIQRPQPIYQQPVAAQPQPTYKQTETKPVFAPGFAQSQSQQPIEQQPSRPQPIYSQPTQPMSKGLRPSTKAIAPHKLSPIIQAPPEINPDPALVEVLGRKKPDYTPIEPFIQKELKPQVVKPQPIMKVEVDETESFDVIGQRRPQTTQQKPETQAQPAKQPEKVVEDSQLAEQTEKPKKTVVKPLEAEESPQQSTKVPWSLMPIYDEQEQRGRYDYYGGGYRQPQPHYSTWPYGQRQDYYREGYRYPQRQYQPRGPTWSERQHAYASSHPIKSFDSPPPSLSRPPLHHGPHGLREQPLWGRDFEPPAQFDFLHGPPRMGDPAVTGHRDEPVTDAERRAGQRYAAFSPSYGGGYLGLPQTQTKAEDEYQDVALLVPKETHLITPGQPHIPGLITGGRDEYEFQSEPVPLFDRKQAKRERKIAHKAAKPAKPTKFTHSFFNNEEAGPSENLEELDSQDDYMKDSFNFNNEDSEDSLVDHFDSDFLDNMPNSDDDDFSELDFNNLHSNQMYQWDPPVYGTGRQETPDFSTGPQAIKPAQTKDPWSDHPIGPPLPRAPYVDRYGPVSTGPMIGPQGYPGRDYAVLDWGGGSYGSEYGGGYGSEYDLGGIPPFETKQQKKMRKEREKAAKEQQKQEQKMREKRIEYEMQQQQQPYKLEKERLKWQEEKARQDFQDQQQYQWQQQPQYKLEKERMKMRKKEAERRMKQQKERKYQKYEDKYVGDQWQIDWRYTRQNEYDEQANLLNPDYSHRELQWPFDPEHEFQDHRAPHTHEYEWEYHYYPDEQAHEELHWPIGGSDSQEDQYYNHHYSDHKFEHLRTYQQEPVVDQYNHQYHDTPEFSFAPFSHHDPGYEDEFWFSDYHPSLGHFDEQHLSQRIYPDDRFNSEHETEHPLVHKHKHTIPEEHQYEHPDHEIHQLVQPHKASSVHEVVHEHPVEHHDSDPYHHGTEPHLKDVHLHSTDRQHKAELVKHEIVKDHPKEHHDVDLLHTEQDHQLKEVLESHKATKPKPVAPTSHSKKDEKKTSSKKSKKSQPQAHDLELLSEQHQRSQSQTYHEPVNKHYDVHEHQHEKVYPHVYRDHDEYHLDIQPEVHYDYQQAHEVYPRDVHPDYHRHDEGHHLEASHDYYHDVHYGKQEYELGHPLEHHHKPTPVYDHHQEEEEEHYYDQHYIQKPSQDEHHYVDKHTFDSQRHVPEHEEEHFGDTGYASHHYKPHQQQHQYEDHRWHERDHELLYWPGEHYEQDDYHRLERDHPFGQKHTAYREDLHHDQEHREAYEPDHQFDYATHHYSQHDDEHGQRGHEAEHWDFDHFAWYSDRDHHVGDDPHDQQHELPIAHDHRRVEAITPKMSLPEFEFKPMVQTSSGHGAHERHPAFEEEENWLHDPDFADDDHYHDPYGLRDYTYGQIYHDYDFHIEQDPHDEEMYHISYPPPAWVQEERRSTVPRRRGSNLNSQPRSKRSAQNGLEVDQPENENGGPASADLLEMAAVNETPLYIRSDYRQPVYLQPDYTLEEMAPDYEQYGRNNDFPSFLL